MFIRPEIESVCALAYVDLFDLPLLREQILISVNRRFADVRVVLYDRGVNLIGVGVAVHRAHRFKDELSLNGVPIIHNIFLLISNIIYIITQKRNLSRFFQKFFATIDKIAICDL